MRRDHYDVVVVGGGSAGVGAAVGAARAGAKTLLVEAAGCLGGAATLRNVTTFCGLYTLSDPPRQVVFAVAEDILRRLKQRGAVTPPQRFRGVFVVFDPEQLKLVLDEVCEQAGVELRFHSQLIGADRRGEAVSAIITIDTGGRREITAAAFVDATGDANLAALCGASTRYGNAGQVNLGSLGTRFGGISAETVVTAQQLADAVRAAAAGGVGPLTKDRSVVVRLPISGDLVIYVASADFDPRDARARTMAEVSGRRQAAAYLQAVRSIAGCANAYLVSTGPQFGIRESRHLDCVRQFTWQDIEARRSFADCVALGAWGAEWHDRASFESTFCLPPERESYDIPLSCLISRDTPNLLAAGRTADGDRKAGAAIRVMGTSLATGQAAGVAAAHVADGGRLDPAGVAVVRNALRAQGAVLTTAEAAHRRQ